MMYVQTRAKLGDWHSLPLHTESLRVQGFKDCPWFDEACILILQHKKVNAIKLHRAETGFGLKESKAVIDQIEGDLAELRREHQVKVDKVIYVEDLI